MTTGANLSVKQVDEILGFHSNVLSQDVVQGRAA